MERDLGGKASMWVDAGSVVRVETPGGGGYGQSEHS
ncbi:MAG: hydantoinase B/oxoprolinase family protein [Gemmatimonadetes bacterium]|nr:hydantoinase B/oxoprolinase family protein [Gemmatimonadota bacterium]